MSDAAVDNSDRWTMLIPRNAVRGARRFDEFQRDLGIARDVLTARLNKLVEYDVLELTKYQAHPPRSEDQLTPRRVDLSPCPCHADALWRQMPCRRTRGRHLHRLPRRPRSHLDVLAEEGQEGLGESGDQARVVVRPAIGQEGVRVFHA